MSRPYRQAFTLVELLVVIGIIAVLIAILLPALNKAREQARFVAELSDARQLAISMTMYATDNDGWYPRGRRNGYSRDDYVQYHVRAWDALSKYLPGTQYPRIGSDEPGRVQWVWDNEPSLIRNSLGCQAWQDTARERRYPIPGQRMERTKTSDWNYWNTELHVNIFVGRSNDYVKVLNPPAPSPVWYKSPNRLGSRIDQSSSRTMFTCRQYTTNQTWEGQMAHWPKGFITASTGRMPIPVPKGRGLTVGYVDGSARFVPWDDLGRLTLANANQTWIYYDPQP